MESLITHNTIESFPKRIRSVSAKLFSINQKDEEDHTSKRISLITDKRLNPSNWFPRIRCRSSSSASSTFSIVFSTTQQQDIYDSSHYDFPSSSALLDSLSSELESLYKIAKEELDFAIESQGSIYYEGDKMTAQAAIDACEFKYKEAMSSLGDTTHAVKFRFRWESDLYQLETKLNNLPIITHSIYD